MKNRPRVDKVYRLTPVQEKEHLSRSITMSLRRSGNYVKFMPKEDQYIIAMRWYDQVERVANYYDSLVKLQFKVVIIFLTSEVILPFENGNTTTRQRLPNKVMSSLPPIKHSFWGHADVVAFNGTFTLVPQFLVKYSQIAAIYLTIGYLQIKSMHTHSSNL